MYETDFKTKDFLEVTYKLMQKKVVRLIEIEKSKKRNKLPLPMLKEKFESTSNILKALRELINVCTDKVLIDILNDMGILLSQGNIAEKQEQALQKYDAVLAVLDGFLFKPDLDT